MAGRSLENYIGKIVLFPIAENTDGTESWARIQVREISTDTMFQIDRDYLGSIRGKVLGEKGLGIHGEDSSFPVFLDTEIFVTNRIGIRE